MRRGPFLWALCFVDVKRRQASRLKFEAEWTCCGISYIHENVPHPLHHSLSNTLVPSFNHSLFYPISICQPPTPRRYAIPTSIAPL